MLLSYWHYSASIEIESLAMSSQTSKVVPTLVSCESLTLMRKRFHCHLMAYVEHGGLEFPFSESLRTLCRKVLILTKTTEMLLSPSKDHRIEAKEFLNG